MDKKDRLLSLDAFRGFDMMWIMGGDRLICSVAVLLGFTAFPRSFGHVPWAGFQFMDTIFPTFLFMAGASFPFSAAKSLERGMTRGQIALRALRRGLTLMVLGIICGEFLKTLDFAHFRIPSVLGYIGFGWMVAAWIALVVKSAKARLAIAIGILTAVTLVFGFIPAPDAATVVIPMKWAEELGRGVFTPAGNLGCWMERTLMGSHILHPHFFDNEGIAGLFCTIVTAMLGMFAGEIVRAGGVQASGKKALQLLGCAVICLVAGLSLSCFYPIVKNLWSPSFVLVAGAYAYSLFALFYWIIDVKKRRKWCFFFQVIGMNAITIYVASGFIDFRAVATFFLGGTARLIGDWGAVLLNFGRLMAAWLFLWFLYKKDVFLKV